MEPYDRNQAYGNQAGEAVPGFAGHDHTAVDQDEEQDQKNRGADESQLLPDGGEDEVRVLLREEG
jgi:hypothetical protein